MSNGSVLWFDTLHSSEGLYPDRRVLHRADGPAIERPNGEHSWYWWGVDVGFQAWAVNARPDSDEMAFYILKYFKA